MAFEILPHLTWISLPVFPWQCHIWLIYCILFFVKLLWTNFNRKSALLIKQNWTELNSTLVFPKIFCVDIPIAMTTYLKSPLHLQLMRLSFKTFICWFIYALCYPEETRRTSKNQSACHLHTDPVTVRRFHKRDKIWWMQDGKKAIKMSVFLFFSPSSPCLDSSILCSMHEREAVWSVSGVSMTVAHREALKCAALPRTLQPIAHSHAQKAWIRPQPRLHSQKTPGHPF